MIELYDLILGCVLLFLVGIFFACFFIWKKGLFKHHKINFFKQFENKFYFEFVRANRYVFSLFFDKSVSNTKRIALYLFWGLGVLSEIIFPIICLCVGLKFSLLEFIFGLMLLYLYLLMVANNNFFVSKKYQVRKISILLVGILLIKAIINFIKCLVFEMSGYLEIVSFIADIGNIVFYGTLLYTGFGKEQSKLEKYLVYSGATLSVFLQTLGLFGCFSYKFGFVNFFSLLYLICATFYILFFFDEFAFAKEIYKNKVLKFYDNVILKKILKKEPPLRRCDEVREFDVEIIVLDKQNDKEKK